MGSKLRYDLFMTYLHTYKIGFIQYIILHSVFFKKYILGVKIQVFKFMHNPASFRAKDIIILASENTNSCSDFFLTKEQSKFSILN